MSHSYPLHIVVYKFGVNSMVLYTKFYGEDGRGEKTKNYLGGFINEI